MALRISLVIWLALLAQAGSVCDARAQLIEGPQGAVGGLFGGGRRAVNPNRDSQSFEASFDLSGGYDRDPNALFFGPGADAQDLTQWYAGTGEAAARYRAGSLKRSLEASGRAYMNYQSAAGDSLVGGEGLVNGSLRFGPRRLNQLTAQFQSSYEPGWAFGAFGAAQRRGADAASVGGATPMGVFEQRWLVLSGTAGYRQQWNVRHGTAIGYDNRRLRRIEGGGFDSDLQTASVEQSWVVSRAFTVQGAYSFHENVQRNQGSSAVPSVRYQSVDAGVRYDRRLSPVRRYSVRFRGGLINLFDSPATENAAAWHPSLNGALEFVPSSRTSLSVEYTRAVVVLAGVSVIPVLNDIGQLTVAGSSGRRFRYSILASASRGDFLSRDPGISNSTDVVGASGELRYAVANWAALFATYGFYHHRIDAPTAVASGFPTRYERQSIRLGMTLWLPLYGTF
jgi:hypothetical protein